MPELSLLIQTSNGVAMLALAQGDRILFDTSQNEELRGSREYRQLLELGLSQNNACLQDVTELFVDIGPGGLGVTRTAAAFMNALGFALGLPVTGVPAFELLGAQAAKDLTAQNAAETPIVILRKAAKPFVHFGLFERGELTHYEHCERSAAQAHIDALPQYICIGNAAPEGQEIPASNAASMEVMLRIARQKPAPAPSARAYPIVEVLQ